MVERQLTSLLFPDFLGWRALLFLIGVGGCDGREEGVQRDVQRNRRQREATRPATNTFNGKVIKFKDGDSIVVLRDKE